MKSEHRFASKNGRTHIDHEATAYRCPVPGLHKLSELSALARCDGTHIASKLTVSLWLLIEMFEERHICTKRDVVCGMGGKGGMGIIGPLPVDIRHSQCGGCRDIAIEDSPVVKSRVGLEQG